MEWKIGEIRQIDGEWYQCLESHFSCEGCDFKNTSKCSHEGVECSYPIRQDRTSVIFKKLEKIGEPFELLIDTNKTVLMQEYKIYGNMYIWENKGVLHTDCFNGIRIEIKQNKKNNMEKKNVSSYDNDFSEDVVSNTNGLVKNDLKPFDIQKAKDGKPVCTRDGRKVRIISFDREFIYNGQNYCIVALISEAPHNEIVYSYTEDGLYNPGKIHERDLMMLSEKKSGWLVIRKDAKLYNSEEAAKNDCTNDNCIPVKVEFEI